MAVRSPILNVMGNAALKAARGLIRDFGEVEQLQVSVKGAGEFVSRLAAMENVTPAEFERQFFETARPSSIIKRFATVDEVAALVAFVCSPAASAITGRWSAGS